MKKLVVLGMGLCVALAFSSCKSSESAYKKAYEKAKQQELAEAPAAAEEVEAAPVAEARQYRKAPMERLMARLDLTRYDKPAPITEMAGGIRKVKLMCSQHIGAPAVPVVKEGDRVEKGQMVAEPANGLSVAIHASIDGKVTEVTEKYIIIQK